MVAAQDSGSRVQLTILVQDVDATCAEREDRGVQMLNGPMDRPWGVRTASFTDPGGHIWEIAHCVFQETKSFSEGRRRRNFDDLGGGVTTRLLVARSSRVVVSSASLPQMSDNTP